MDRITGRANHIEDVLVRLHDNQWFNWSDSRNKIYENLILTPKIYDAESDSFVVNPHSKPTKQELEDGLAKMQSDFDSQDYARKRELEYPSILELVIALYDTEDRAAIDVRRAEIKIKYPKP